MEFAKEDRQIDKKPKIINEIPNSVSLLQIKEINNKIKVQDDRRKSNFSILQQLLAKIEQLQYLKQTEGEIKLFDNTHYEKTLEVKIKEIKSFKSILNSLRRSYELAQINSEPLSIINKDDLIKENSSLKLKIRELKMSNNTLQKEIEHCSNPNYYPDIIQRYEGELKQLVHKKSEFLLKSNKHEKSISSLKEIFSQTLNEFSSMKELFKEQKLYVLKDHLNEQKIDYETISKLFFTETQSPANVHLPIPLRSDKSAGKYTAIVGKRKTLPPLNSGRIKPVIPDKNANIKKTLKDDDLEDNTEKYNFDECSDTDYNLYLQKLESLKALYKNIEKSIILNDKTSKKKLSELQKAKDNKMILLDGIKDENDLVKNEIYYLSIQLTNIAKEKEFEEYLSKDKVKTQILLDEVKEIHENKKKANIQKEEVKEESKKSEFNTEAKKILEMYKKYNKPQNLQNQQNDEDVELKKSRNIVQVNLEEETININKVEDYTENQHPELNLNHSRIEKNDDNNTRDDFEFGTGEIEKDSENNLSQYNVNKIQDKVESDEIEVDKIYQKEDNLNNEFEDNVNQVQNVESENKNKNFHESLNDQKRNDESNKQKDEINNESNAENSYQNINENNNKNQEENNNESNSNREENTNESKYSNEQEN